MTRREIKGRMLNRLSHRGTPKMPSLKQTVCVEVASVQGLDEGWKDGSSCGQVAPITGSVVFGGWLEALWRVFEVPQNRTVTQQGNVANTTGQGGALAWPSEYLLTLLLPGGKQGLPNADLGGGDGGNHLREFEAQVCTGYSGLWLVMGFQRGFGC